MANSDFLGTGFKFPFSMDQGKLLLSEAEDSIRESILLILRTVAGERIMRPDFGGGIGELVFSENNPNTARMLTDVIERNLINLEPRIRVEDVRVTSDGEERNKLNINIEYKVIGRNNRENLVFPYYLET